MTTHRSALAALHGLTGLSGMGQTCPSEEQLEGIVDLNDPCQSGLSTIPLTSNPATIYNPVTGTLQVTTALNDTATSTATPSSGITTTEILVGVGVLGLLLLMIAPGGRR
jgi:hypothetical protein